MLKKIKIEEIGYVLLFKYMYIDYYFMLSYIIEVEEIVIFLE